CVNELGGRLSVTVGAVWATCATGMMAAVNVSRDGRAFTAPHNQPWRGLPNSATTVVDGSTVLVSSLGRAYVSTDSGEHWRTARIPGHGWEGLADIQLRSDRTGYALQIQPTRTFLIVTDDAGDTWSVLPNANVRV